MTKVEALEILSSADHGFFSAGGVRKLGDAFGIKLSTYTAYANPQDFKGLSLYDKKGKPVDKMVGQNAEVVAMELCNKIGLPYQEFYGKGSQLSHCCKVLNKWIAGELKEKAPTPVNA